MNCWALLDLQPTLNKSAIKRAYVGLLKKYHPEEDAEGFQRLHEAYKQALYESDYLKPEDAHHTESPIVPAAEKEQPAEPKASSTRTHEAPSLDDPQATASAIMNELVKVYGTWPAKCDPAAWQALLDNDTCWHIEVRARLCIWLVRFLHEHPFIPTKIYQLLNQFFAWTENVDYLDQHCEEEHIDTVFSRIKRPHLYLAYEAINFAKALDSQEIEGYFACREMLDHALFHHNNEQVESCFNTLSAFYVADAEVYRLQLLWHARHPEKSHLSVEEVCHAWSALQPNAITPHLTLADLAYNQGHYHQAINSYLAALSIDSNHAIALRGLAKCHFKNNHYATAKALFEQVRELLPYDLEAPLFILQIQQYLLDQALATLKTLPHPWPVSLISQVATAYFGLGRYDDCLAFITEASRHPVIDDGAHPDSYQIEFRMLLANVYSQLDQFEKSFGQYEQALRLALASGGNGYEIIIKLAEIEYNQKMYDKVIFRLQSLVEKFPENHYALYLLAESLRLFKFPFHAPLMVERLKSEGLAAIQQAIALYQDDWRYYYARGQLLIKHERYVEALPDFAMANKHTYNGHGWYYSGICLENMGEYEEAVDYYQRAIDRNFDGYADLIQVLLKQNKVEQAHEEWLRYEQSEHADAEVLAYWKKEINTQRDA